MKRKLKELKALLIPLFFIGLTTKLFIFNIQTERNESRDLSSNNQKSENHTDQRKRPVVHTFFDNIDASVKGTGMTEESDEEHVAAWKEQWSNAGWDPVVLNLEDAKKHPRYDEFVKMLEKVPLLGGNNGLNKAYNQLCFFRWLAMAAVGGGWMSDYDVIPLRHIDDEEYTDHNKAFLPNDGFFTVHCVDGGSDKGIPCLMSGDTEEWEKMAFKIVQNGVDHPKERLWSDMMALMDLRHENSKNELFFYDNKVIAGEEVLLGELWRDHDCHITDKYKAVHFSHHAIGSGKLEGIEPKHGDDWDKFNGRPAIIQNWHSMWRKVCGEAKEGSTSNPHFFNDLKVLDELIDHSTRKTTK